MPAALTWSGKEAMAAYVRWALAEARRAPSGGIGAPDALGWHVLAGDNLPHLLRLAAHRSGEVDLVYLDPPYNCGYVLSAYDDTSSDWRDRAWLGTVLGGDEAAGLDQRERWLNLVYARLLVLADLLAPDGTVVASIDSCEMHHLIILIGEIFGERGPVRSYAWPAWPHATPPRDAGEVPVRMNHLLISAPADRHCTLPMAALGSVREGLDEIATELGAAADFDTPKPQRLLRHLLREHTTPSSVTLDPYAGSGSFGVAVTAQNRADGGQRTCVLIERSVRAMAVLMARAATLARGVRLGQHRTPTS